MLQKLDIYITDLMDKCSQALQDGILLNTWIYGHIILFSSVVSL